MARQLTDLAQKADVLARANAQDPATEVEFELRFGSLPGDEFKAGTISKRNFQIVHDWLSSAAIMTSLGLVSTTRKFQDLFYGGVDPVRVRRDLPKSSSSLSSTEGDGGGGGGGGDDDDQRHLGRPEDALVETRPLQVQRKRRRHDCKVRVLNCQYNMRWSVALETTTNLLPFSVVGKQDPIYNRIQHRMTFTCAADGISIDMSHVTNDQLVETYEIEIEQIVTAAKRATPDRLLTWATRIASLMMTNPSISDATLTPLRFIYPAPRPSDSPSTSSSSSSSSTLATSSKTPATTTTTPAPMFIDGDQVIVSNLLFVSCSEFVIDYPDSYPRSSSSTSSNPTPMS